MDLLLAARSARRIFAITFPDGTLVRFRQLTLGEYTEYQRVQQRGIVPQDIIEQAIWRDCVLDYFDPDALATWRAGIVSTLAGVVMAMSMPSTHIDINNSLEYARNQSGGFVAQMEMLICRAFPAYKPEDIHQMSWDQAMYRLAQAERILMSKNPPEIQEPLSILDPNSPEAKQQKKQASGGQGADAAEMMKQFVANSNKLQRELTAPSMVDLESPAGAASLTAEERALLRDAADARRSGQGGSRPGRRRR